MLLIHNFSFKCGVFTGVFENMSSSCLLYFRHLTENPIKWWDVPAALSSCWIPVSSKESDRLTE